VQKIRLPQPIESKFASRCLVTKIPETQLERGENWGTSPKKILSSICSCVLFRGFHVFRFDFLDLIQGKEGELLEHGRNVNVRQTHEELIQ
jgi:hypothetical protein